MSRKEALKYLKHLALLMLSSIPLLLVLDMFCFKNMADGLIIFLDVVIGLVWVFLVEQIITCIKKAKDKKIIRPCTDAFKNNPIELEKYKGKASYFYN